MDECIPQCKALKLLVIGIVLVLARLYTAWDIWVVIGTILVIKAIILLIRPICPCNKAKKKR